MTQEQKNHIQQLAKEHFRYSFSHIKAKADSKRAHLEAYYLFLVDDFFAVSDAAISREAIKAYDPNATILDAIWSGECEEDYNGSYVPVQKNTDNWLDNQSHLYKETYLLVQALDGDDEEEQYDALRKDFEDCLLNALAECDKEGLFGNREENGLLLFAFYIDDYDENDEGSLLYRSTELLNPKKDWDKLKG